MVSLFSTDDNDGGGGGEGDDEVPLANKHSGDATRVLLVVMAEISNGICTQGFHAESV